MTKYICIDCETSGIFDFKKDADADGQPRLAELSIVYLDEDLNIERVMALYVKPDGWEMQPGAIAANGLTDEFLEMNGVPICDVLDIYESAILGGYAVVAHNAQFDCKMMRGELRRAGRDDMFENTPNICTMRNGLSLAKQIGRPLIKYDADGNSTNAKGFPKLTDLCRYFNVPLPDKAHSATDDARAVAGIFKAMVAEGFDREPSVHYSKNLEEIRSNK